MMTNEQIQKEAEKYSNQFIDGRDIYQGFIKGANFVNQQMVLPLLQSQSLKSELSSNTEQLKAEREWISVEDRLPEVGEYVIVITEYTMKGNPASDTLIGYMNEVGELIELPIDDFYGWLFNECVTHWMPLPSTPNQ